MKKSIFYIAFVLLCISLSAQQTKEINNPGFNKVIFIGKMNVELIKSNSTNIEIKYDGITEDKISVTNEDNILKIKINSTYKNVDVNIKVFYTELSEIRAHSSAVVNSNEILESQLSLNLIASSGGEIQVNVETPAINATSKTQGLIMIEGKTDELNATAGSGGTINALTLTCENATIKAVFKGKIRATANDTLTATTKLGGFINYTGTPKRKIFKPGGKNSIVEFKE